MIVFSIQFYSLFRIKMACDQPNAPSNTHFIALGCYLPMPRCFRLFLFADRLLTKSVAPIITAAALFPGLSNDGSSKKEECC